LANPSSYGSCIHTSLPVYPGAFPDPFSADCNAAHSWQCAYQVNIRFHAGMIADDIQREKLLAMVNVYFQKGGQELQINVVDTATLRAAQKDPDQYRDLVVRVAGFSEFFVNLTPDMQEEIIARTEHL
jgi:formate C-acetyltransferase